MQKPEVTPFYDARTHTITYVVADPAAKKCVIIDSVLDYDPAQGRVWTESIDVVTQFVESRGYQPTHILETHIHADHLSGGDALRSRFKVPLAIGRHIDRVQDTFGPLFNDMEGQSNIQAFDKRWSDGETFTVGSIPGQVIFTPGHTPADTSYLIGDALFVGDTMFLPDVGVARCDFPGGSAADLYDSVQKLYRLPEETRMYVGHDYPHEARTKPGYMATIAEQKANNIELPARATKDEFVAAKRQDDAQLDMPRLIIPSIQVNIRAGQLPDARQNGVQYLKIPLNNVFTKTSD